MSHYADEPYSVYNEEIRKARKEHKCDACKETIPIGIKYTKLFIIFEGEAQTIKRCNRCQTIHEHLRGLCQDAGRYGELWPDERLNCGQNYKEEWDEEPPLEIQALAFALPNEVQP